MPATVATPAAVAAPAFQSVAPQWQQPGRPAKLTSGTPQISGPIGSPDATLSADPGAWTTGASFSYQWQRDGENIDGANNADYTLTPADQCHRIRVQVRGTKDGFIPQTQISPTLHYAGCPSATGAAMMLGEHLAPGKSLTSTNGKHELRVTELGELQVLNHGRVRWRMQGLAGSSLIMHGDGRLAFEKHQRIAWSSRDSDTSAPSNQHVERAVLRNDGDLVLVGAVEDRTTETVWALSDQAPARINSTRVPYFSQLTGEWAGRKFGHFKFGHTGCVPTSFAMAAGAYGVDTTPIEVGAVMNAQGDFNRAGTFGAGGKSIVAAAKHFGLQATPLASKKDIRRALANDQPVLAMVVGPKKVTKPGAGHTVVLTDYHDGIVTARNSSRDPWQEISLDTLFEHRSFDALDRNAGAVFWAIG